MTTCTHPKLRCAIAALTAAGLLCAMPAGFAAGETATAKAQTEISTAVPAQTASTPFSIVRVGKKWGALAPSGTLVIPAEYDEITSYAADALAVRQGKKWGIIRLDGPILVPVAYKGIDPIKADTIVVQDAKDKYGAATAMRPYGLTACAPHSPTCTCRKPPTSRSPPG